MLSSSEATKPSGSEEEDDKEAKVVQDRASIASIDVSLSALGKKLPITVGA
jgi:hypothetical protein